MGTDLHMKLKLLVAFIIFFIAGVNVYPNETDFQWELFEVNGNYGAKNAKGKILIPAKYSYVNLENGSFTVKDRSGDIGKYDISGHLIFPPYRFNTVYEVAGMKDSPFIVISDRYGVMNRTGKLILKDEYTAIKVIGDDESGRFFILYKNGFQGVANINGDIIISPDKYQSIGYIKTPDNKSFFTYTRYGEGSGVCNERGKVIARSSYLLTIPKGGEKDRYYEISNSKDKGLMNKDGDIIVPIESKKEQIFQNISSKGIRLSIYMDDHNKFYIKNALGNIISAKYDWIGQYNDNFLIYDKETIGLMSADGKEIISPKQGFTFFRDINGNYYLATHKNGCQSVISLKGEILFSPIHRNIQMHTLKTNIGEEVLFKYRDEIGAFGVKDKNNNIIISPIYDNISYFTVSGELYFKVYKDGFCGLQSRSGTLLFRPEYHDIDIKYHKGEKYYLLDNGYKGLADKNGNIIINPETFDNILFSDKTLIATIGKRICKFSYEGKLLSDNIDRVQVDEYTNQADEFFKSKNYKKAAEFYGKALEISPTASLYFNRGVSFYNNNKYPDAISDFNRTLSSKPSERLRVRSIELIEKAEHYQQEKEFRQQQLASAIFGLALTGINIALQVSSNKSRPVYNLQTSTHNSAVSQTDNQSDTNNISNSTNSTTKQKCGFCAGKGSIVKYTANYGIDNEPWCDECGKKVASGHYHQTCTKCHGSGEY